MKRLRSTQGFTLIELVVIILVLGILAVTAIPRFIDLRDEAREAACEGVVGAVRGGIAVIYASNLLNPPEGDTFPTSLDNHPDGDNSTLGFFSIVLDQGVANDNWTKAGLAYTCDPTNYNQTYTYNATTGAFN